MSEDATKSKKSSSISSKLGDFVYESLLQAVMEHRLPPGARLPEEALAEAFGVSRTRVRTSLQRLQAAKIIVLRQNHGASVASPTVEETREVFGARRVVETGVTHFLVTRRDKNVIEKLRHLCQIEREAQKNSNIQEILSISARFHVAMAEATGSVPIADLIKIMVCRTSLFVPTPQQLCDSDDHYEIVQAIEDGDADRGIAMMNEHLVHLENAVRPTSVGKGDLDLVKILRAT
jgi:DNA-binding GntR family transcriptional regulator